MANEKLCLKDYLTCQDDDTQSKTRKKMNKKSHKGRHHGLDHGYRPENLDGSSHSNTSSTSSMAMDSNGGSGSGVSESTKQVTEMRNGVLPAAFTANILSRGPEGAPNGNIDMKKQNRRNAPRKRSFAEFLKWRNSAEEEEFSADFDDEFDDDFDDDFDEPMNDFDRLERNRDRDPEYDQFRDEFDDEFDEPMPELRRAMGRPDTGNFNSSPENEEDLIDIDDEPNEFDDLDPEEELDFDDRDDLDDDDLGDEEIEDIARVTGRFVDFYRDDQDGDDESFPETGDDVDSDEFERQYDVDPYEEEEEPGPGGFVPGQAVGPKTTTIAPGGSGGGDRGTKIHQARVMFKQLVNNPDLVRKDIINMFIEQLGITESTAVSYYERLAKEAGLTKDRGSEEDFGGGMGSGANDDMADGSEMGSEDLDPEISQDEIDQQPPDRQGIIRQVDDAHLVYKRQMEDGGFEELWVYNIGDKIDAAIKVRRAILAGTDIPRGHTRSEDGHQTYTLSTMGNAQLLHITGLSN